MSSLLPILPSAPAVVSKPVNNVNQAQAATSSNGRVPSMRDAINHSKSYMRMRAPERGSLTS